MAILHPDSDLSLSLVFYGADVLGTLNRLRKPLMVEELLERFLRSDKRRTPQNFFSTLEMLFATGTIDVKSYKVTLCASTDFSSPASARGAIRDLFDSGSDGDA